METVSTNTIDIAGFAWPAAVLIAAIAFMLIFRGPISSLINRIREVTRDGIRTGVEPQQQSPDARRAQIEELMNAFDSPSMKNQEAEIQRDLDHRGLHNDPETVRVLVRHLAATQIQAFFERTNSTIWGSQLAVLEVLNSQTTPIAATLIRPVYEKKKNEYPLAYANYTFENWLGYLEASRLVENIQGSGYQITQLGREFLTYLTATGRTQVRMY